MVETTRQHTAVDTHTPIITIKHCDKCGGSGYINTLNCGIPGCAVHHSHKNIPCSRCNGTGHIVEGEQ